MILHDGRRPVKRRETLLTPDEVAAARVARSLRLAVLIEGDTPAERRFHVYAPPLGRHVGWFRIGPVPQHTLTGQLVAGDWRAVLGPLALAAKLARPVAAGGPR